MEYTILVVDDDEDLCQILEKRLERMGYIVHTATCGRDALNDFPGYQTQDRADGCNVTRHQWP